jgi:hypothetical protein
MNRSISSLLVEKVNRIGNFFSQHEWQFRQEKEKEKLQTGKDALFFDLKEAGVMRNKGRSHSIISELD